MTTVANSNDERVQISFRTSVPHRKQIRIEAALDGLNPSEWLENLTKQEIEKRMLERKASQSAQ